EFPSKIPYSGTDVPPQGASSRRRPADGRDYGEAKEDESASKTEGRSGHGEEGVDEEGSGDNDTQNSQPRGDRAAGRAVLGRAWPPGRTCRAGLVACRTGTQEASVVKPT